MVFLFAPTYHPAMRHVGPVRRELGIPTIMNLLGPLANPAGVSRQVIGVSEAHRAPLVAEALLQVLPHCGLERSAAGADDAFDTGLLRACGCRHRMTRAVRVLP